VSVACLVDITRCVGCRSCQVACKQANERGADENKFFASPGGYQNPARFTPNTFTYVSFHELDGPDGPRWVFVKRQCLHCAGMPCAPICPPQVYGRTESGVVVADAAVCIGCAACVDACPLHVPSIDYWDVPPPRIRKCTFCLSRQQADDVPATVDGRPLSGESAATFRRRLHTPACVNACPTGALQFGERPALLAEARRRIAASPGRYVDRIYGEHEYGGTAWLYLSGVPFEQLDFPGEQPDATFRGPGNLGALEKSIGTLALGLTWFCRRREEVRAADRAGLTDEGMG
jgi:formate dehydrogenase iron-sulfur subunit